MSKPAEITLAESAAVLVVILNFILQLSDDVKNAASPLDAQGRLLRMQASIQQNGALVLPYVKVVSAAVVAERSRTEAEIEDV